MKKTVLTGFIIGLCLLIIPLVNIKGETKDKKAEVLQTLAKAEKADTSAPQPEDRFFRIKTANGIKVLSEEDYIIGVVSAEMPASFGIEALKAQSVAAYTFALYKKEQNKGGEYDLTDSYRTDQSYLSPDALKEKWGEEYENKTAIIKEAVSATAGEYLSFGGEVALTLYHALSSGFTNSCADVFGSKLPYLISVDSQSDKLSPDYQSVFSFSADELTEKLAEIKKANVSENLFSGIKTAKSGLVKEIKYAGEKVTGAKICELLSLPAPTFSVEYSEGGYTFTCLGRGHGVGMSQYGAGQFAQTGSTYREILAHYYPGTELVKS